MLIITAEDALPVFHEVLKVREALRAYCLSPDKIPVSLDDLTSAIGEEYGAKVDVKVLPFKSDLVRGMIRIYDPRDGAPKLYAQIIVDSELNLADTRYVATKEMSHIVLHNAENCTHDPTGIIEFFVQDDHLAANGDAEPKATKNEKLADVAAYELLFPHELRAAAKERLDSGEDTLFSIADWLEIPEHVVEYVLRNRYLAFASQVWGVIYARAAA